jgi:hypothetical protein
VRIRVHKDPWQPWNLPGWSLRWWNPPGWHMDRTFTTATTGITGGITIGITPGITLGIILDIILAGITPGITLGAILGIILDILLADIVLLRADIVGVVNMQSMEVVEYGDDFWITHNPAKAASAAFCFHQNSSVNFDYLNPFCKRVFPLAVCFLKIISSASLMVFGSSERCIAADLRTSGGKPRAWRRGTSLRRLGKVR